ncbi:hypothetical protein C8N25_10337 [Algoriphagus antarcticus]|uniref:Uncharacterized protein n=1 Tax=Algoriphagus antarcticus TaxID=238540 RepID=A0A3E0E2T3_9BACT|nr:hypothetical protein C8N25_10337 [Algoriphagus antarcticus]
MKSLHIEFTLKSIRLNKRNLFSINFILKLIEYGRILSKLLSKTFSISQKINTLAKFII